MVGAAGRQADEGEASGRGVTAAGTATTAKLGRDGGKEDGRNRGQGEHDFIFVVVLFIKWD